MFLRQQLLHLQMLNYNMFYVTNSHKAVCLLVKGKTRHFHMHVCYLDILLSQLSIRGVAILIALSLALVDVRHP